MLLLSDNVKWKLWNTNRSLQWQVRGEGRRHIPVWRRNNRLVIGWINNSDCTISKAVFIYFFLSLKERQRARWHLPGKTAPSPFACGGKVKSSNSWIFHKVTTRSHKHWKDSEGHNKTRRTGRHGDQIKQRGEGRRRMSWWADWFGEITRLSDDLQRWDTHTKNLLALDSFSHSTVKTVIHRVAEMTRLHWGT